MSEFPLDKTKADFELKALLRFRKMTIKALAKNIGVDYHSVQKVVDWQRNTQHIKEKIANSLRIKYEDLWGDNAKENLRLLLIDSLRDELLTEFNKRINRLLGEEPKQDRHLEEIKENPHPIEKESLFKRIKEYTQRLFHV